MPAARLPLTTSSHFGSYIVRESSHNQHRFTHARDDASRPYPTANDVYVRSTSSHVDQDEFSDLGLSDFFLVHRRVARRSLERLQLSPYQAGLFSRGVQTGLDRREPYNAVLEASIGYAGACSVAVIDEVASLNERVERLSEENERLRREVEVARDVSRVTTEVMEREKEANRRLRQQYQETRMLVDGLVGLVGELRDDFTRHVVSARYAPRRRAETPVPQELIQFGGRLVPIGEPDRAESRSSGSGGSSTGLSREVEIIDLTDDPDTIVDYFGEEQRQAEEAVERGEVTTAAEIRMAQADPSPEYEDAPPYEPRS